jgi:hypothetical protein
VAKIKHLTEIDIPSNITEALNNATNPSDLNPFITRNDLESGYDLTDVYQRLDSIESGIDNLPYEKEIRIETNSNYVEIQNYESINSMSVFLNGLLQSKFESGDDDFDFLIEKISNNYYLFFSETLMVGEIVNITGVLKLQT